MTSPSKSADSSPDVKTCGICFEEDKEMEYPVTTYCGHDYCFPCISEWQKINNMCPRCQVKPCKFDLNLKYRCIIELKSIHRDAFIGAILGFVAIHGLLELRGRLIKVMVGQSALNPNDLKLTTFFFKIFEALGSTLTTTALINVTIGNRGLVILALGALAGTIGEVLDMNPYISAVIVGLVAGVIFNKTSGPIQI